MIVRAGGGYQVKSEGGKNLSKPGLSKTAAKKRLAQVEYFKHQDDPRSSHPFVPKAEKPRICADCGWPKSIHGVNKL